MIPRPIFWLMLVVGTMMSTSHAKPTGGDDDTLNTILDEGEQFREQYGRQMMSYMNHSVKPCDDFYEYACGNWKNTIQPRQTKTQRSNFVDIEFKLDDFVGDILQRADISDMAPEYVEHFELAKKFYHSCLETEVYPMRKSLRYLEYIEMIGGFPAVNPKWDASKFNWIIMSAHLSSYGVRNFINEIVMSDYPFYPTFPLPGFGFDVDLHNDTIQNIQSREYQWNTKRMYDILTVYGLAEDRIDRIIADIFEFLKTTLSMLANFQEDQFACDELSKTLDETDFEEINKQWLPYFDIVWKGEFSKLTFESGPCIFFYHEFIKIAEQHHEAMANYLSLMFLHHMDADLQDPKMHPDFCNRSLRHPFLLFFDHLYMKMKFNKEMSDDTNKMFKELQQSLLTLLQTADWLDEPTREAALLKTSSTGLVVGRYEDSEVSERLLDELKNVEFVDGSFETNRLNLKRFENYMKRYYGLHHQQDIISNHTKSLEMMVGMKVNAFFYPPDNCMYINTAALQPPMYHPAWPNSFKYATLGYILGHEFGHGYDTMGRNYDHTGKLNNWWSDESAKVFLERAGHFAEFYSNYTVPEINRHINGKLTLDENIADAGSLHIALMAYQRYAEEESKKYATMDDFYKAEQMTGVDASPEQLFFLGAAQMWCASFTVADYWRELLDYHTIDKYRVLGMMSNNEDFARAYNCPVGSNMNPKADKCRIV